MTIYKTYYCNNHGYFLTKCPIDDPQCPFCDGLIHIIEDIESDWINYFMNMVYFVALKSENNTKIGAVITKENRVISTGYNGIPKNYNGFRVDSKNLWYEHAERSAIYSAAYFGIETRGCQMYTNGIPCPECARAIIQSGIKQLYFDYNWCFIEPYDIEKYLESTNMFKNFKVDLYAINFKEVDVLRKIKDKESYYT